MSIRAEHYGQLSLGQTIARLAVGAGMILLAILYQGDFSSVVLLPLLAVYPITTGIIRVDPVYLLWQSWTDRGSDLDLGAFARTSLVIVAATMIGLVLTAPHGPLGLTVFFALGSVYPALAAIIGKDPFNAYIQPQSESKVVWLKNSRTTTEKSHLKAA